MNDYELTFILRPDLSEKDRDGFVAKTKKYITDNKGEITASNIWGKKKLAYEIKKIKEGFYVNLLLKIGAKEASGIDRRLKVDESVLRYLLVKRENSKLQEPNTK